MKLRLLIIDDDEDIRSQMKWALREDYEVRLAGDRTEGMTAFDAREFSVVLLDLGLPPRPAEPDEGLKTLAELLKARPLTKVIIISGQSEHENALRAVGEGAYDFLAKPVNVDELKLILKRAFYIAKLEREHRELLQRVQREGEEGAFDDMLGNSPRMQDVFDLIRKVAASEAPVLILGESGTGKEKAARSIHRRSAKNDGPFVAISCGAIPDSLLESELFGHEKGAFTGAHAQQIGKVELANDGTLFLDEVGELPMNLQVKLLRFLQQRTIERIGGREEIPINARVIAATNVDLDKALLEGRFREDLYYRLAVVSIDLPPLRERENDVAFLAKAFLNRFATEHGKSSLKFSRETLRTIKRYRWPGNVRELENRIKRSVIMAEDSTVTAADLELPDDTQEVLAQTLKAAREAAEKAMILKTLRKYKGKVSPAAKDLGISRPTLYELMDKLDIPR